MLIYEGEMTFVLSPSLFNKWELLRNWD